MDFPIGILRADRLPFHSHNAPSDKQGERAHEFQIKSIGCLHTNALTLLDKRDELCEVSNSNSIHLVEISETRATSQITDRSWQYSGYLYSAMTQKRKWETEPPCTYDLAW